jgi:hypothetical protein
MEHYTAAYYAYVVVQGDPNAPDPHQKMAEEYPADCIRNVYDEEVLRQCLLSTEYAKVQALANAVGLTDAQEDEIEALKGAYRRKCAEDFSGVE